MKQLLVLMVLLIGAHAFACQEEAQFIGKVMNHKEVQNSSGKRVCTFQIDFSRYDESMVCPLNSGETAGFDFIDKDCSLNDGDQAPGGYIIRKDGVIQIEGQ